MIRLITLSLALTFIGCAQTRFYDTDGNQLHGLPFVYLDAKGNPQNAFVQTTTGFGTASFTLKRNETGGYTEFATNLDSTAAATLAGNVIDKAFEAGKKAGVAETQAQLGPMLEKEGITPEKRLKMIESLSP